MRRLAAVILSCACLLHCIAVSAAAQPNAKPTPPPLPVTLDSQTMRQDTQSLSELPHRLAGSKEGWAAGDLIIDRLKRAGIDDDQIMVQSFPVTNAYLRDDAHQATLQYAKQTFNVHPVQANGLMLSNTPTDGIQAPLVDVGTCDWPSLNPSIRNSIALVRTGAGNRWLRLLAFGPAAIVFEADQDMLTQHWLDAHIQLPRFQMSSQDVSRMAMAAGDGGLARLDCPLQYRTSIARNIIVNLPASGTTDSSRQEAVLMLTSYDTLSATPLNVRAPQQAANVAGLIQAAAWFRRNPQARPVTFVFLDNHAQAQSGQLWFQWARMTGQAELERLMLTRQADMAWTQEIDSILRDPAKVVQLLPETTVARQAQKMIHDQAQDRANENIANLSMSRIALAGLDRQATMEKPADEQEALAARQLLVRQVEVHEKHRETILHGRRVLAAGLLTEQDQGEINPFIGGLFEEVRSRFTKRQQELSDELAWLTQTRQAVASMAGRRFVMAMYFDMPLNDTQWVIAMPSTQVGGFVINQRAAREMNSLAQTIFASDATPEFLNLTPLATPGAVTATMTWTLTFGHHGEPAAHPMPWSETFTERFSHALHLAALTTGLPSLSDVRLPQHSTSLQFNLPAYISPGRYEGSMARLYDEQTKLGKPAPQAVIRIRPRHSINALQPSSGSLPYTLVQSSQTGAFGFMALLPGVNAIEAQAAIFDDQGRLQRISQFKPGAGRGSTDSWENASWYLTRDAIQIPLFQMRHQQIFTNLSQLTRLVPPDQVMVYNGRANTELREFHGSSDQGVYVIQSGQASGFKLIAPGTLVLGNQDQSPLGYGHPPDSDPINVAAASANDIWRLNESRLDRLRRHGIDLPWIEQTHTLAQSLLDDAQHADSKDLQHSSQVISATYSNRVYQPIRDVTNDLIRSVVILLMLAIPFAYACERLIFGSGDVFRQIISFSCIFLATFAILFWVHPAFRFAGYPLIVLLAFLIIVMSSLVIWIMWSKFEYEMRRFHGVATASHQNTRDARATVSAAIAQGIATMKRRPLRTFLTMATIAILTFTVLFFGSFSAEPSVRWINKGVNGHAPMVVARPAPASPWRSELLETLRAQFDDQALIYSRSWGVASSESPWAGRTPDQKLLISKAWIGVPPEDLDALPQLQHAMQGDIPGFRNQGGIMLPGQIDPDWIGKPCWFMDRSYIIRGSFDPEKLANIRTADDATLLALDISEMRAQLEHEFPGDPTAVNQRLVDIDAGMYPTIDASQSVLISTANRHHPENQLQSVVFMARREDDVRPLASQLAILLDRTLFANTQGSAQRVAFHNQLQLGGLWAVAVPLLLGGLLVFSSMMSSVSDRQREIFTFSALGLAPRHIVLLFFAEATVYGLVGAMCGYLGSQVFAKATTALGRMGWFDPPPLNYSSTNAVITLVVIILAVLVSTIYPAIKASRSANPGIQRSWRMPSPVDDKLELEFPFTVSHDDMTGLIVYLNEFFQQHSDQSIGGFAARNVHIGRTHLGGYRIGAEIWLAPFDQGVSQRFELCTEPSDITGIDRVLLSMQRTAGSPAMWHRGNKLFVAYMREQFLLWRTLSDDTVDHYHSLGESQLGAVQPARA